MSELSRAAMMAGASALALAREEIEKLRAEKNRLKVERDGENERAEMLLKAKDEWVDRARAAEAERDALRAEVDGLRKDAARFRFIEDDADSGMSRIYGDNWISVIDAYLAEYNSQ